MKIYNTSADKALFTSDLHFNHHKIIEFCDRPYKNIDEMNSAIIENWNSKVSKGQTVFVLGDISWKGPEHTKPLIDQLNGKIVLIRGNHDNNGLANIFDDVHDMLGLNVTNFENGLSKYVHLCHYPMSEWDGFNRNSWHLHGHLHSSIEKRITMDRRLDVGLDGNDMQLYTWNDIEKLLNK